VIDLFMKNLFKVLSVFLLVGALAGGVYLASKSQETRRGATANETSVSVLPSEIKKNNGEEVVAHVYVNSGLETDKVSGIELTIKYGSMLQLVETTTHANYDLIKSEPLEGGVKYSIISKTTAGSEVGGSFEIATLKFKAVADGEGMIEPSGRLVVMTADDFWEIATLNKSQVKIGDGVSREFSCEWCGKECVSSLMKGSCTQELPAAGTECKKINDKCEVVRTFSSRCDTVCQGYDECGSGMACNPVWWPTACPVVTKEIFEIAKENQGKIIDIRLANEMFAACSLLRTSDLVYENTLRLPSFVGKCKNVDKSECGVEPVITPTITPIITPTTGQTKTATLSLAWNVPKSISAIKIGDEVTLNLGAETADGKISAISTSFRYPVEYFDLVEIKTDSKATVQKKSENNGVVELYLTYSLNETDLSSKVEAAKLILKAKKVGVGLQPLFDSAYRNEVSGVSGGESFAYTIVFNNDSKINVLNPSGNCKKCENSDTKKIGDADCSGVVDSVDFEYWRREVFDLGGENSLTKVDWEADFDCDTMVTGVDFEIWRAEVFK